MVQRAFTSPEEVELPEDITDKERERYNNKYGDEGLKLERMECFWEYFFAHLTKKGVIEGGEW